MWKQYFLGLDIGKNSVGYATTDTKYELCRSGGKPMWGVSLFEEAKLCNECRAFRTSRRRLDRRQQRVHLLQEIFAEEIAEKDPQFYIRIKNSSLWRDNAESPFSIFNDSDYTDKTYHSEYPTIHHLIVALTEQNKTFDVRLVYLACAWLVAHRGHFLSDVSKESLSKLTDFSYVYNELCGWFSERDIVFPKGLEQKDILESVLKQSLSVSKKYEKLKKELLADKNTFKCETDTIDTESFMKLLCGSKVSVAVLFNNEIYAELGSMTLDSDDDVLSELYSQMDEDDALLLQYAKAVYDWSVLVDILNGNKSISRAKVTVYEQHAKDLKWLKNTVKEYCPARKYYELFRDRESKKNYVAYGKCNGAAEVFFKDIRKLFSMLPRNAQGLDDAKARLEAGRFLPKQVTSNNRVIPYQLYWYELDCILKKAEAYLPFLLQKDSDGITASDKIRSIFVFRIPYFVGPLHPDASNYWLVRKSEGKIYPWALEKKVDLDASEERFIRRMTGKCTYLPGEDVLPKDSLLYHRFTVLNELNNLKIDNHPITVEMKQELYTELFLVRKKVTRKKLEQYLRSRYAISIDAKITGIDDQIHSDLSPQQDFAKLLSQGVLTEKDVEIIILRRTATEDKQRFRNWLKAVYPLLCEEDIKYISGLRYNDFGRLSYKFLAELNGVCKETGEATTIIKAMWETNNNLMELLSDKYTFTEQIKQESRTYYSQHPMTIAERLDAMYISNAVKRPIIRTLDIVREVTGKMGNAPQKIFVEMARGGAEEQKDKHTKSRKQQIEELYTHCKNEDIRFLRKQLAEMGEAANSGLQSKRLFLYYMQLGRDMYTGEQITLSELSTKYNIDHIYPQSMVKDDSILNNMVLVNIEDNERKSDIYPVDVSIRNKMHSFWVMLRDNGLITEEKYRRLTRSSPFSADEKWNFINRQITETTQSTKAIATLLQELYPETEIVYVKARLTSVFRQEFDCLKSHAFNDLHHAKDAYLNIVTGNVYHSRFTKQWFYQNVEQKYNVQVKKLFIEPVKCDGIEVWDGKNMLSYVRKTIERNDSHMTCYSFCRKGGLFNRQPVKGKDEDGQIKNGLVPLKKNLPTEKYGGYNKPTVTYFLLVKYHFGKKSDVMFMPVQLLYSNEALTSEEHATAYAKERIGTIIGKPIDKVSFPLGLRKIKINAIISLDGFRVAVSNSFNKGKTMTFSIYMPFRADAGWNRYIKALEELEKKLKVNPHYFFDSEIESVSIGRNVELYNLYIEKLQQAYANMPTNPLQVLLDGKETFTKLSVTQQSHVLLQIHQIFGRSVTGCDLTLIGGKKSTAVQTLSSNISNWKKTYSKVHIIDTSASGLYESKSQNLLELL